MTEGLKRLLPVGCSRNSSRYQRYLPFIYMHWHCPSVAKGQTVMIGHDTSPKCPAQFENIEEKEMRDGKWWKMQKLQWKICLHLIFIYSEWTGTYEMFCVYDVLVCFCSIHYHNWYQPLDPHRYPPPPSGANMNGSIHSPSMNWLPQDSPHIVLRYPTTVVRNLPLINAKCPLSPDSDDHTEMKHVKVGSVNCHNASSSGGWPTLIPSRWPSPIPFYQQPTSHSPESHQVDNSSSTILTMLPPHLQLLGAGLTGHTSVGPDMPLPSLNTSLPSSMEDNDMGLSHSASPLRGQDKCEIILHSTGSSQELKGMPLLSSSHYSHMSHLSRGAQWFIIISYWLEPLSFLSYCIQKYILEIVL